MTRRTPTQRTIDAEVRAVEEGHHARLGGGGKRFLVKSDTKLDTTYRVGVQLVAGVVVFECDHISYWAPGEPPQRTFVPCKHGALCARRLEREGMLRWDGERWQPTDRVLRHAVTIIDKAHGARGNFELDCSCGWGTVLATTSEAKARESADAHVAEKERSNEPDDPFEGLPH